MSSEYNAVVISFCTYVSRHANQWQEHGLAATPAGLQSLEEWALRGGDLARSIHYLRNHEALAADTGGALVREHLETAAADIADLSLTLRTNLERLSGTSAAPPTGFEATIRCLDQLRITLADLHGGLPRESADGAAVAGSVLADAC